MGLPPEPLAELFPGSDRAYGEFVITPGKGGGKLNGKAQTVKNPVSLGNYKAHVDGTKGLGIIPINSENMVKWGAIDVDKYDLDIPALAGRIDSLKLPLVICRSKSGGAHLFLFMQDWAPAALVQGKLKEWAAVMGFGNCEIFPKQTEILVERGDIGGWINLPYFKADATTRYAVGNDGKALDYWTFYNAAQAKRIKEEDLAAIKLEIEEDLLPGCPPCLSLILKHGVAEGTRNETLFMLGVYCRMAHADNWQQKLADLNHAYFKPPVGMGEMQGIIKSLGRKEYHYTCDRPLFQSHCNASMCRLKEFGVGGAGSMPALNSLTKLCTAPPIWFVEVEGGGRMELTTEELQNQSRFQSRCIESLNLMPPSVRAGVWRGIIQGLLDKVQIIEVPKEVLPRGVCVELIEKFCTGRVQASNINEIVLGKPFTDRKRHFFRMPDLLSFLERMKFDSLNRNQILSILKELGGQHHFHRFNGKGVNYWSVPEFEDKTPELPQPKIPMEDIV